VGGITLAFLPQISADVGESVAMSVSELAFPKGTQMNTDVLHRFCWIQRTFDHDSKFYRAPLVSAVTLSLFGKIPAPKSSDKGGLISTFKTWAVLTTTV